MSLDQNRKLLSITEPDSEISCAYKKHVFHHEIRYNNIAKRYE